MAQVARVVLLVDWGDLYPRNIRFMGVRTIIDTEFPLIVGCFMKRDNGVTSWVNSDTGDWGKFALDVVFLN